MNWPKGREGVGSDGALLSCTNHWPKPTNSKADALEPRIKKQMLYEVQRLNVHAGDAYKRVPR